MLQCGREREQWEAGQTDRHTQLVCEGPGDGSPLAVLHLSGMVALTDISLSISVFLSVSVSLLLCASHFFSVSLSHCQRLRIFFIKSSFIWMKSYCFVIVKS